MFAFAMYTCKWSSCYDYLPRYNNNNIITINILMLNLTLYEPIEH